jgi:uncharacterized protein YcbK (DUF882 family)
MLAEVCFSAALMIALASPSSAEERTLSMYNIHTQERVNVTFKRDGQYIPEGLAELNHFMRDWRRNIEIKMDPALFDLIWELHEELGSKEPVQLICGHRSEATNEMLRRTVGGQAKFSRHITGQAADLVFPDVPLKQLRYAALVHERGGVGFYPTSAMPFVHVDTGNVRHWPGISRNELAVLFPKGHSLHVPSDGRPLTPADYRIYMARWQTSGEELPWVLTHKHASTMLASLNPADMPKLQQTSLTLPGSVAPRPTAPAPIQKPESSSQGSQTAIEPQLSIEDEEQEDDIGYEPLPATFLLADKPLLYSDAMDEQAQTPSIPKIGLLMVSPSALASEEFDHRLQVEDLYEANVFKGPAIGFVQRMKARMAAASGGDALATR